MKTNLDIIQAVKSALLAALNEAPKEIILDSPKFIRFGESNRYYYKVFTDGLPSMVYGDHKTGLRETVRLFDDNTYHTQAELDEFKATATKNKADAKKRLEKRQAETAIEACSSWRKAFPASPNNPYLLRKKIQPHSAREGRGTLDSVLFIPLVDESLQIVNIQRIFKDGTKRFLSGGKKAGCFFPIGKKAKHGGKVIICEGVATGVSIHEATGEQVIVALDAGNLEAVAKLFRSRRPDVEIIIAADNDVSGVGQSYAQAAALAVNGRCVVCPIAGMDFNDYVNAGNTINLKGGM